MNESIEHLCEQLKDPKARYVYADGLVNAQVAAQIKINRETRDMSQQDLADAIGTKQSGISRLENVNYSSWRIESLRKLARAFGLWLDISFREFGDLPSRVESFNRDNLSKRKFEDDPAFAAHEKAKTDERATSVYFQETARRYDPVKAVIQSMPWVTRRHEADTLKTALWNGPLTAKYSDLEQTQKILRGWASQGTAPCAYASMQAVLSGATSPANIPKPQSTPSPAITTPPATTIGTNVVEIDAHEKARRGRHTYTRTNQGLTRGRNVSGRRRKTA
jgi:transcriptional regulator with XRE-family HTH domain